MDCWETWIHNCYFNSQFLTVCHRLNLIHCFPYFIFTYYVEHLAFLKDVIHGCFWILDENKFTSMNFVVEQDKNDLFFSGFILQLIHKCLMNRIDKLYSIIFFNYENTIMWHILTSYWHDLCEVLNTEYHLIGNPILIDSELQLQRYTQI